MTNTQAERSRVRATKTSSTQATKMLSTTAGRSKLKFAKFKAQDEGKTQTTVVKTRAPLKSLGEGATQTTVVNKRMAMMESCF